ncbi:MAG TPA: serine/threonine-protein kinase [Planctomycetota bacterium]|nr:serine/threonine-protein kinase [Planctomycetota bacterium]
MTRIGDYEVEGEIGRGGAGRVLRARHAPTGAVRALKVLEGAADPVTVERFRREAQALARVGADVAVAVHETGAERGRVFYVMDFMPGGSLEARLERDARIGWREAAALVARLARSVARCHAVGIVHRDLKPANVLFDERGEPRLADFGCVRDLRQSALTETGTLIGTPAYMAPEQLDGRHAGSEADVYALGAILHELVAGAPPHSFRSWHDLLQRAQRGLEKPVAAEVGAPSELDRILAEALAPQPEGRPGADALAGRLEALARSAGRGRGRALALLVVGGVVVLGALLALTRPRERPGPAPPVAPVDSEDLPLARIKKGDVKPGELERLAASAKGMEALHGLAQGAVIVPLEAVSSVTSTSPRDLRTLAALAHVAATADPVERARWLQLAAQDRPGGETDVFLAACFAVLDKMKLFADMTLHKGDEFDGALRPLGKRPDLVGIAVAPLAHLCREDLLEHCLLASEPGISIRKADALEGALDQAPPEVAADYIIKADKFPGWKGRDRGWSNDNARRRADALEKQADRLEAKGDFLLAFLVYLNTVNNESPTNEWIVTDYASSEFARHVGRAHALLEKLRDDPFAGAKVPVLDWELCDAASRGMLLWTVADRPGDGVPHLERTLAEVERALAGRAAARAPSNVADHANRAAVLLVALGRGAEVASIPGLEPDDPLRVLAATPLDPEALERAVARAEADPRLLIKGSALAIRIGLERAHDRASDESVERLKPLSYFPGNLLARTTQRLVRAALRK